MKDLAESVPDDQVEHGSGKQDQHHVTTSNASVAKYETIATLASSDIAAFSTRRNSTKLLR